ncbi:MAG: GAF domain-containing protein [Thermosynechococcaceae cyanobacterium]
MVQQRSPSSDRGSQALVKASSPDSSALALSPKAQSKGSHTNANGFDRSKASPLRMDLWVKVALLAIASMLPILTIGAVTYQFGAQQIATTQVREAGNPPSSEQGQKLLLTLLAGTGALALLTGLIVAYLAQKSMRSTLDESFPSATKAIQGNMSERLQVATVAFENLHTKTSEDEIYTSIVKDVRQILEIDRVIIYGLDDNLKEVVLAESVAPGWTHTIGSYIPDPCFEARYIEKYRNGRFKAIDDIHAEGLSPCYLEQLEAVEVKALIVAPIVSEDNLLGLLIGHQCADSRVWKDFEMQWFKQIAAQVGFTVGNLKLATQNKTLQQQAKTQVQWMQYFTKTVQNIWAVSEPNDIFNTTVRNVRNILDVDRVVVYGLDQQFQEVIIAESIVPDWPSAIGTHIPDPCFQARYLDKYEKGRVKSIANIYEANLSPCYIEQLAVLKVKALLTAPIVHGGRLVGLLIAHQCYGVRDWQRFEIEWFTQIAAQVGLALDHLQPQASTLTPPLGEGYPLSDWV